MRQDTAATRRGQAVARRGTAVARGDEGVAQRGTAVAWRAGAVTRRRWRLTGMGCRRGWLATVAISLALGGSAIGASSAGAAFHLIKVREVYPGASDDSYVVLQMLAAGENFVGGHSLRVYGATGATIDTFTFSPGYVAPNGGHGNNTILVGDTGVQARFGVVPDDHADPELNIPSGGGAACWLSGSPPDCVAWGNFSAPGALPAPGAGTPADAAFGIPDGLALRRTIARACPTLLEAADDTDDSAADFFDAFPAPRPNSAVPTEFPCSSQGTPGGGGAAGEGAGAPGRRLQTRIVRRPGRVTRDRTPTFGFRANRRRARFQCGMDRRRFRPCRSPFTARRLSFGCHVFRVRARVGRTFERSPAVHRFRVAKRKGPGLRQFKRCRRS